MKHCICNQIAAGHLLPRSWQIIHNRRIKNILLLSRIFFFFFLSGDVNTAVCIENLQCTFARKYMCGFVFAKLKRPPRQKSAKMKAPTDLFFFFSFGWELSPKPNRKSDLRACNSRPEASKSRTWQGVLTAHRASIRHNKIAYMYCWVIAWNKMQKNCKYCWKLKTSTFFFFFFFLVIYLFNFLFFFFFFFLLLSFSGIFALSKLFVTFQSIS